jgi:RES domain-containing protein
VRVWRIATKGHQACDGEGARLYGSRWTSRGQRAVFASATLSLAALERFVHADPDLDPPDLVALSIDIASNVTIETIEVGDLPAEWREYPPPDVLTRVGQSWLLASKALVLSVPSAVIPHERNYVINPSHAAFARAIIGRPAAFSFDPRMWKRPKR